MLKYFFTIFLFIFLHIHVFAMCEKAFSGDEVFTSFAKKQLGEQFEHYKDKFSDVAEHVKKNWTPEEASQFLDFLITRVGKKKAAHILHEVDFLEINPKRFMETVQFYDQINKNIVPYKLLDRSFSTFSSESLIKQRKINDIITNHFGKEVLAFMIINYFNIYEGNYIVEQANQIGKVVEYINSYTEQYKATTVPLKDRLNTLRQALLPAAGEKSRADPNDEFFVRFKINDLQELRKISKILIEGKTKMVLIPINKVEIITSFSSFHPRVMVQIQSLERRLTSILYGILFQPEHKHLKETVHILEQYIKPEEIVDLLMRDNLQIYSVDPKNLEETINTLIYNQIAFSRNTLLKAIEELKEILKKIELDIEIKTPLLKGVEELPADISDMSLVKPKELISETLRTIPDFLLSANPKYVRDVISILKNSMGEPLFFLMNRIIAPRLFENILLEGNPIHLRKIIDVLERNFEKEIFQFVVANYLDIIISFANRESEEFTKELDSFIKIIQIISHHVGTGNNFLRNVVQLLEVSGNFHITDLQKIHKELAEMHNTKDHDAMKKLLELNIEDWSPSLKESMGYMEGSWE